MDKKTVELAVALHGHLAPGIALGLRMCELALSRLDVKKGNKHLIGISETARCLADAVQAATGCTLGHGNAYVEDYGKLAITIGDTRTKRGVRVALRDDAGGFSQLMNRWMMRLGKLSHEEEDELSKHLLVMDEEYFLIQDIEIDRNQNFESSAIARCSGCGEFIPLNLAENTSDGIYCRACRGERYCKVLQVS